MTGGAGCGQSRVGRGRRRPAGGGGPGGAGLEPRSQPILRGGPAAPRPRPAAAHLSLARALCAACAPALDPPEPRAQAPCRPAPEPARPAGPPYRPGTRRGRGLGSRPSGRGGAGAGAPAAPARRAAPPQHLNWVPRWSPWPRRVAHASKLRRTAPELAAVPPAQRGRQHSRRHALSSCVDDARWRPRPPSARRCNTRPAARSPGAPSGAVASTHARPHSRRRLEGRRRRLRRVSAAVGGAPPPSPPNLRVPSERFLRAIVTSIHSEETKPSIGSPCHMLEGRRRHR